MAKRAPVKTPVVHVVLDTNVLFTEAEDQLISREISSYIQQDSKSLGIEINWHLPAIVRGERRRQMFERAIKLLEPIAKMEKLLGHNLAINPDIVGDRVDAAIMRQVISHGLNDLDIVPDRVDWPLLISAAVERRPPFSGDKSEKGFKDAIILECFLQLIESSPKSPQGCRIALLCNDDLLAEAAKGRTAFIKNAVIVRSLEDLKTMLNAVAAHISQEEIDKLVDSAKVLFFSENSPEEYYSKWNLNRQMWDRKEVNDLPGPDYKSDKRQAFINRTTFLGKEGQTVKFETEIEARVTAKSVKYGSSSSSYNAIAEALARPPSASQKNAGILSLINSRSLEDEVSDLLANRVISGPNIGASVLGGNLEIAETRVRVGRVLFSVIWSSTLTQAGSLIRSQFVELRYKETTWNEETVVKG